ncbi:MAG: hypothetical protein ACREJ4_16950, partial [Candidatus Methylomirabilaceae bacterium]
MLSQTAAKVQSSQGRPDPRTGLAVAGVAALFWLSAGLQAAQLPPAKTPTVPVISIPRLTHPPTIEDFLEMKPSDRLEGEMASIEGLIQREPSDGQPETQRTVVYFGYDDKNLYVVFVCFDSEPEKIRARRVSRENIIDDDVVEL